MSIISEQVKELRELADGYKMADRPLAANTIYQAADTIEVLSAKLAANSGWIPCSERLPEEDGFYLVTLTEKVTDINDIRVTKIFFSEKSNSFTGYGKSVIAWQPLPEAYHE